MILILHRKKLPVRASLLAEGYTSGKWQSRDLIPGLLHDFCIVSFGLN